MDRDLDTLTDDVCTTLQLLDVKQLGQCCDSLDVVIPPAKMGKKAAMKTMLMRHLTSDELQEDDKATEILETLSKEMESMVLEKQAELGTDTETAEETTSKSNTLEAKDSGIDTSCSSKHRENTEDVQVSEENKVKSRNMASDDQMMTYQRPRGVEFARLREFKVTGGTIGGTESIGYQSLCYQIQEAKALTYNSKEIVAGIIKAMKAGSSLRKYCEGHLDWTLTSLMVTLRNFYNVKTSTELLDEMSSSSQDNKETEMNFVLRMMGLRDNIITLTKAEDYPLSESLVRNKFCYALSVGFLKDTIRLELGPILRTGRLDDAQLMKEVNDVVTREADNRKKTKASGKSAMCHNLNMEPEEESPVLKELTMMMSRHMEEMSTLQQNFQALQTQVQTQVNSISGDAQLPLNPPYSARPPFTPRFASGNPPRVSFNPALGNRGPPVPSSEFRLKCAACEVSGAYCTHCNHCGKGTHKRRNCPDLANRRSENDLSLAP